MCPKSTPDRPPHIDRRSTVERLGEYLWCGHHMDHGDLIGCGDAMGCVDYVGGGIPIGCGDPTGCGDPMGRGGWAIPWAAAIPCAAVRPWAASIRPSPRPRPVGRRCRSCGRRAVPRPQGGGLDSWRPGEGAEAVRIRWQRRLNKVVLREHSSGCWALSTCLWLYVLLVWQRLPMVRLIPAA